jgi:hypothetical protein
MGAHNHVLLEYATLGGDPRGAGATTQGSASTRLAVRRPLRPFWRPCWLRFTYVASVLVKKYRDATDAARSSSRACSKRSRTAPTVVRCAAWGRVTRARGGGEERGNSARYDIDLVVPGVLASGRQAARHRARDEENSLEHLDTSASPARSLALPQVSPTATSRRSCWGRRRFRRASTS